MGIKSSILFCLLLFFSGVNMYAQQKMTISGSVVNESGQPLSGATIVEGSSTNTTLTDQQGHFNLSVASGNTTLEVSYTGYISSSVPVNNQSNLSIVLKLATSKLDEVVVIGYGTQKKSTLTGAVSAVKGDEVVRPGAANISQTMAGKISGLSIQPESGEPGDNPVIHIRGIGTTGSSAPLVVIDGIIRDNLADIDPSIIESVSVLKDAAAVAPYGLGGANGVLLITTKTGRAGKPILTVDAYKGNQKATWLPNPLNAVDYMKLQNEAATNVSSGSAPPYTTDFINNYNTNHQADPDKYPDARASDLLNKLIPVQNYNLKASGGSGNTNYFIGGGYFKQDGLFDQINFHRYNFNINVNSKVTESTKINVNIINSFDRKNELSPNYSSASMLRWIYFVKPTAPLYFSNGKWGDSNNSSLVGGLQSEVLLNYAEAQNEAVGPDASVYEAINAIRTRPGTDLPELTTGLSKDEMRKAIHRERRIELSYEQKRLWDIWRWKEADARLNQPTMGMKIYNSKPNDNSGVWVYEKYNLAMGHVFTNKMYFAPIPQEVIDRNPKIIQNLGY